MPPPPPPPPQRSSAEKRGGGGAPHTPEKLAYFSSLAHMKGLLYRWLLIHTLYTYLFQLSEKKNHTQNQCNEIPPVREREEEEEEEKYVSSATCSSSLPV